MALTACGGGGGGGGGGAFNTPSNPYLRSSVPYHTPVSGGSYSVYTNPSTSTAVLDIFAQDLNRDNVQEVVVGGRMSQPATAATWQYNNLQVYGWNNGGSFGNETTSWFSGVSNSVAGSEPGIKFGDFNGDGNIDMFVAPSTDGALTGTPGTVFFNSGASNFNRRSDINLGSIWAHDSAVVDMNSDGYADLVVTDYHGAPAIAFGSANGTFTVASASGASQASGMSIADYLGNGTKTIIYTDAASPSIYDTKMYSWSVDGNNNLTLTEIYTLPASRFYLSKWDTQRAAATTAPHDIRNVAMDFNNDGRMDVIVVSRLDSGGSTYTELQFLKNNGSGSFTDVTDSVLSGFNTNTSASYQPVLVDVNKDGLVDILVSSSDTAGSHDSTQVLLQTSDGYFKAAYASTFTDFYNQTKDMTSSAFGGMATMNIAAGPNGELYLITQHQYTEGGELKAAVYAAKIGSAGTTSVQQTLANISTIWPYLNSVEANTVLAQTASSFINGIPVIDWQAALNPIGGLGITLDGRTGRRIPLNGSISMPGMDKNLLSNLSAVDAVGRHFQVNLSGMTQAPAFMPVNFSQLDSQDVSLNWTSRLVSDNQRNYAGMSVSGTEDNSRYAVSFTNRHFGGTGPTTYRFGAARMEGSPWFNFSGVFGQVENSMMLDFSATRSFGNNWFLQGGVIQTSTTFQKGLVQDITPLYSGYAVSGYQDQEWTVYGGLQPTVFAGHLDLKLPTRVDNAGTMHYTDHTIEVRNRPVGFMGFERRWDMKKHGFRLSGVINDLGQAQTRANYEFKF